MVQTLNRDSTKKTVQSQSFLKTKWTNNTNKFEGCFLRGQVS